MFSLWLSMYIDYFIIFHNYLIFFRRHGSCHQNNPRSWGVGPGLGQIAQVRFLHKTNSILFLNIIREIILIMFAYLILLGTMLTSSKNVVSLSRPSRQKWNQTSFPWLKKSLTMARYDSNEMYWSRLEWPQWWSFEIMGQLELDVCSKISSRKF